MPAALENSNCIEIFDMESGVPATIYPQYITLTAPGGELEAQMQTGYWISGMDAKFGMNIPATSYRIEFDFDPGDVTLSDGLYIIPFDLDFDYWNFYMGSYFCDGTFVPAAGHYSYTYTPSFTGTNTATYLAFNTNGSSTHKFKIDNLTMCPIADIPIVQNYNAEILKTADYYPFGMEMPGRKFTAQNYRYGFNGQEHDDEVFVGANTAEYWMYDARLGRRWENDPVTYSWQSPYSAFNNNPIYFSDPLGLEGEDGGDRGSDASAGPVQNQNPPPLPPGNQAPSGGDGQAGSDGPYSGPRTPSPTSPNTPPVQVPPSPPTQPTPTGGSGTPCPHPPDPKEPKKDIYWVIRYGNTTGAYGNFPVWIWPVYNSQKVSYYNSPYENAGKFKIDEPNNFVQIQGKLKNGLEVSFAEFKQKFHPFGNGFKYEGVSNIGLGISWTSKAIGFNNFNFTVNLSSTFGPTFAEPKFDNAPGMVKSRPNISGYSVVGYGTAGILRVDANLIRYISVFMAVNFHQFRGNWINTTEGGQRLEYSGSVSATFGAGFNITNKK